jgi:hypothetical protein
MGLRLALFALALAVPASAATPEQRFAEAGELARRGDLPRAIAVYGEIAAAGGESASLYWNWAQVAEARGAWGEALWALLRARELDPGDAAVEREIEEARQAANLDPAELSPEPMAGAARIARRFHLGLLAAALGALSVLAHLVARLRPLPRWPVPAAWTLAALAVVAGALPLAGSFARPTAVVVQRGAPLLDAASPDAAPLSALREGEVVPVLDESGPWLRVQDSSGARGWAHADSVRRLDEVIAR